MNTNRLILAVAGAALRACNKEEKNETPVAEAGDYKGVVTVEASSGTFDNEDIEVNFTPSEDGASATITINKIRFVPQMPVTIDVTIPNVGLTSTKNGFQLACDNVIPLAMGGEYERYTVTNLTGTLKDDELAFSLNFGSTPTSFKGTKLAK